MGVENDTWLLYIRFTTEFCPTFEWNNMAEKPKLRWLKDKEQSQQKFRQLSVLPTKSLKLKKIEIYNNYF